MSVDSDTRYVYTEVRTNAAAEARDVGLIDYSYAPGVPTIDAEFDKAGKPTRVLPLERLVVEDIPQAPPIGTLRPICPVPRVPARAACTIGLSFRVLAWASSKAQCTSLMYSFFNLISRVRQGGDHRTPAAHVLGCPRLFDSRRGFRVLVPGARARLPARGGCARDERRGASARCACRGLAGASLCGHSRGGPRRAQECLSFAACLTES